MIYIITNTNNIAFILVALLIFSILSRSYNKFILISVVSICIVIPFSIKYIYDNVLLDYQRTRIESFLSPTEDLEGSNWQRLQSLRTISNGGVFGKGLFNGDFVNQRMVPFAHTDFAFASLAEQFGLLGSVVLFLAYFWLFSIILNILSEVDNQTNRVAIFGIFLALVVNTMQHIGMNIGMLPITGTTLPFISYGGSSYLSFIFGLGVILSIYNTYISNSKEKMSVVNLRQSIIDQI
jgi:rod shape determining protein RodA